MGELLGGHPAHDTAAAVFFERIVDDDLHLSEGTIWLQKGAIFVAE